jgi:hypothetical protein
MPDRRGFMLRSRAPQPAAPPLHGAVEGRGEAVPRGERTILEILYAAITRSTTRSRSDWPAPVAVPRGRAATPSSSRRPPDHRDTQLSIAGEREARSEALKACNFDGSRVASASCVRWSRAGAQRRSALINGIATTTTCCQPPSSSSTGRYIAVWRGSWA